MVYFSVPNLPTEKAVCSVFGTSNFRTFDKRYYSFLGECTYKLTGDCVDDTFSIHFKQDKNCQYMSSAQCQMHVMIYAGGEEISLFSKENIQFNKENVILPHSSQNIGVKKVEGTSYIMVTGMKGLTVIWDGHTIDVILLSNHANKTCGLCGNFNGSPKDDLMDVNYKIVKSVKNFVSSWKRLDFGEKCSDSQLLSDSFNSQYSPAEMNDDGNTNTHNALTTCNTFQTYPNFSNCRSSISEKPYFDICIKDCSISGFANCSCNAYFLYARACSAHNWKMPKHCGM